MACVAKETECSSEVNRVWGENYLPVNIKPTKKLFGENSPLSPTKEFLARRLDMT